MHSAIDFVGLSHRIDRRGSELSTEERHLAEIAKALIAGRAWSCSTSRAPGMSQSESAHLVRVIRDIPAYAKAQVFLIDHDVELISACCDETMVLDFGKLLALGPTANVLQEPGRPARLPGQLRRAGGGMSGGEALKVEAT